MEEITFYLFLVPLLHDLTFHGRESSEGVAGATAFLVLDWVHEPILKMINWSGGKSATSASATMSTMACMMRRTVHDRWLASSTLLVTSQVLQTVIMIQVREEVVTGSSRLRVWITLRSLVDSLNDLVCFHVVSVGLCLLGHGAVRLAVLTLVCEELISFGVCSSSGCKQCN